MRTRKTTRRNRTGEPAVTAQIALHDPHGLIGRGLAEYGDSFRLRQLDPLAVGSFGSAYEDTEQAIVDALIASGSARIVSRRGQEVIEVLGTGGRLLGDDISSIRLRVLAERNDRGGFGTSHGYALLVSIPKEALE